MTALTHRIELSLNAKLDDWDISRMGSHNHRVGMDNISSSVCCFKLILHVYNA